MVFFLIVILLVTWSKKEFLKKSLKLEFKEEKKCYHWLKYKIIILKN